MQLTPKAITNIYSAIGSHFRMRPSANPDIEELRLPVFSYQLSDATKEYARSVLIKDGTDICVIEKRWNGIRVCFCKNDIDEFVVLINEDDEVDSIS